MKPALTPAFEPRKAADFRLEVECVLREQLPGSTPDAALAPPLNALIEVFSRYAEMIASHINRVPDRNRLAFLNYLGEEQLAPQPARVPLVFSLAAGRKGFASVPAGSRVSAQVPGSAPLLFETEQDLTVSPAQLEAVLTKDASRDLWSDLTLLTSESAPSALLFSGDQPFFRALYLGHADFFDTPLDKLILFFDVESDRAETERPVEWERCGADGTEPLPPDSDTTAGLIQSGSVVFTNLHPLPLTSVAGGTSRWLRCGLRLPVTKATKIKAISLERHITRKSLKIEVAHGSSGKLDISKDFAPLGANPRFGETLYLACDDALSLRGASLTVRADLTNPVGGDSNAPLPAVNATGSARLTWEFYDSSEWSPLGTGAAGVDVSEERYEFADKTQGLTKSGTITFRVPDNFAQSTYAGLQRYWIRVRLIAGDYGTEARYIVLPPSKPGGPPESSYKAATLSPPFLHKLEFDVTLQQTAGAPECVVSFEESEYLDQTSMVHSGSGAITIFRPLLETDPTCYLGFRIPPEVYRRTLPFHLYFVFAATGTEERLDTSAPAPRVWEFYDGDQWCSFSVEDDTRFFTESGGVRFLLPAAATQTAQFGRELLWIRVRWNNEAARPFVPAERILLNATSAVQATSVHCESLGISNGQPHLRLEVSRAPVLEGEQVEVWESHDGPSAPSGDWKSWTAVSDFFASEAGDRHYTIDRNRGQITFGDGTLGRIPPARTSKIRISYRTGGGACGNVAAATITQSKTTLPYVAKVTNPVAAAGGVDGETPLSYLERAPTFLRHRHQAATTSDYEDLARMASPAVARAKCVPLYDLARDPNAKSLIPGVVSVVVVPHDSSPRPIPSAELLHRVRSYLEPRSSTGAELVLAAPVYVPVDIELEVAVDSVGIAGEVEDTIRHEVARFLHPLSGGADRRGWDFGRWPHRSDLYTLLSAIPGVHHIRLLHLKASPIEATHVLVAAGSLAFSAAVA